jgi:hypothetical protein
MAASGAKPAAGTRWQAACYPAAGCERPPWPVLPCITSHPAVPRLMLLPMQAVVCVDVPVAACGQGLPESRRWEGAEKCRLLVFCSGRAEEHARLSGGLHAGSAVVLAPASKPAVLLLAGGQGPRACHLISLCTPQLPRPAAVTRRLPGGDEVDDAEAARRTHPRRYH